MRILLMTTLACHCERSEAISCRVHTPVEIASSPSAPRNDSGKICSIIRGAAVDVDRLAGDETAVLGDEEQAGGGDLVDVALAAERDALGVGRPVAVPFGVVAACVDAAGRDD